MKVVNATVKTLLATSAVTAIVGQRVYPLFAPQNAGWPHIVVHLISEEREAMLGGAESAMWSTGRVSVESRCRDAGGVPQLNTLGEAVIDALKDRVNYTVTPYIVTIRKEGTDETDASQAVGNEGTPDTVRRITDFYVNWRPA